jgi:hypothetical protein
MVLIIVFTQQDSDDVTAADLKPEFVKVQTLTKGQVFVSIVREGDSGSKPRLHCPDFCPEWPRLFWTQLRHGSSRIMHTREESA